MKKKARIQSLTTPFENDNTSSWSLEHPMPQMKRAQWESLCGEWRLFVKKDNTEELVGAITVPYPPESRISGIERALGENEQYVYEKELEVPEELGNKRVILHFGAVDQIARVFVNGQLAGEHTGGYLPFSYDITELLEKDNIIRVEVTDTLDADLPYGKQSKKRGGMWYTPISGIWQSVWVEYVPESYIKRIKITSTLDAVTIETEGGETDKRVRIDDREYSYTGDSITIKIENPILWTPDNPKLYDFVIEDSNDRIESYFALRTVDIKKVNSHAYICLNGKPVFFHGLLDQGYYSDGIYTPATPEGYKQDILTAKSLGFNMLRKHIKIEPDIFYYYCDKYGMIVFQDMVNSGEYRYFADTVLPTVRIKHGVVPRPTPHRRAMFEKSLRDTVEMLYNHPSVCYWTIFNEAWGQYDADRLYDVCKRLDPTRVWDATSGWYKKQKSDVDSEHVYFRRINIRQKGDKPLVLSEFGGYSYKIDEHSYNLDETYGYKKFSDKDAFENAVGNLYRNEIVASINCGLCAAVITQLSDVEDETNGFVTYDRQVVKVDSKKMQLIAKELNEAFEEKTK